MYSSSNQKPSNNNASISKNQPVITRYFFTLLEFAPEVLEVVNSVLNAQRQTAFLRAESAVGAPPLLGAGSSNAFSAL
jgi:hypothetical protein